MFSVLEQFEITKFSLIPWQLLFSFKKEIGSIRLFISEILLFLKKKFLLIRFRFRTWKRVFAFVFHILQSFCLPNIASTKNYMYSRIMNFGFKSYFKLLTRRKSYYLYDRMLK